MSWQLGAFAILAIGLAGGFAWYERGRPDARVVALVGTLAAFAALGRIAFAALPNIKPTTDIVLISGYALGGGPGFAVGALAALTSNFFFGQGPWTPWQMAGWAATGLLGAGLAASWTGAGRASEAIRFGLARGSRSRAPANGPRSQAQVPGRSGLRPSFAPRRPPRIGRVALAIVCGLVGFAFTALQDFGDWVTYSDHSARALGVYVGKGLGFDAVHAAGCVAFALAFGPALTRSIQRFTTRLQVTWSPPGGVIVPAVALAVAIGSVLGLGAVANARAAGTPSGYLLAAQNSDGGFGEASGQPSSQLFTGWAALGLAAAGQPLDEVARGGQSLLDYIRSGAGSISDPGSLERTILVARAAGLSATSFGDQDLVAALRRDVERNGSVSDQVNLTAFAILAFRAAGLGAPPKALGWLEHEPDRDGGFNFATAGGSSDVDDTGAALQALSAAGGSAAAVRHRAVAFIVGQQDRDGGFPSQAGTGSNAQSTAWAVQGLISAGVDPARLHRGGFPSPLAYLHSLTASDGHVDYSRGVSQTPVWVTAQAMMALAGKTLPLAAQVAPTAPPVAHRRTIGSHERSARPQPRTVHRAAALTPRGSLHRSARPPHTDSAPRPAVLAMPGLAEAGALGRALVLALLGLL
jgi:energy-coupling factor transport system substrate-specific component